jgi:hypothetical protein
MYGFYGFWHSSQRFINDTQRLLSGSTSSLISSWNCSRHTVIKCIDVVSSSRSILIYNQMFRCIFNVKKKSLVISFSMLSIDIWFLEASLLVLKPSMSIQCERSLSNLIHSNDYIFLIFAVVTVVVVVVVVVSHLTRTNIGLFIYNIISSRTMDVYFFFFFFFDKKMTKKRTTACLIVFLFIHQRWISKNDILSHLNNYVSSLCLWFTDAVTFLWVSIFSHSILIVDLRYWQINRSTTLFTQG